MKRRYNINDDYFSKLTNQSCYWAGFIAADGNIRKNLLTISLAEKDETHIERFKDHSNCNYPIHNNIKNAFVCKRITITSEKIVRDLLEIYNIGERKSLTLSYPKNLPKDKIDYFICGYIDGDGCICKHKNRGSESLSIVILGTFNLLTFIKNRFDSILGISSGKISIKKNTNIYSFRINSSKARTIFRHFYNLNIYKLDRKWKNNIFNWCSTYKRKNVSDSEQKLRDFCVLFFNENKTIKEVMKIKNLSYKNTHSYYSKCKKFLGV